MRLRRIDRYLLLLAVLFTVAILKTADFPGEEVVADVYRAGIFRPLLAQAARSAAEEQVDLVRLRSELESARRENTRLREELENTRRLQGYFEALRWDAAPLARPASVVTVDADPFRRSFEIDVGRAEGLEPGLPVVTGTALLGLVRAIHQNGAFVTRVDDPNFRIEVEIETEAGPLPAIAIGTGERTMALRLLRGVRDLTGGLPVFTSSYHKLVPPGLLVGRLEVSDDAGHAGARLVRLVPAASLVRLAQVEVLRRR